MNKLIDFISKNKIGEYKENVSFKALTTYKTGGIAEIVVYPKNIDKLKELLTYIKENSINYKVFGNGSNILASDNDYNGVIIKLTKLNNVTINNDVIEVEAGYSFMKLANDTCKMGLSGLEFACGIPGTIGGAIYMNAGAYLKDIGSLVISVEALDENDNLVSFKKEDLNFSYRNSFFINKNYVILSAKLKLTQGNLESIMTLVNERKERRKVAQPLEFPSAGSVFRNPIDDYAGRLIEECNLKGFVKGGAEISNKHANFIINKDNATSSEIKYLMDKAKHDVKEKFNIELKEEQELFNWE